MKIFKIVFALVVLFIGFTGHTQNPNPNRQGAGNRVKVSGKVIAKTNNQALEYTEIRFINVATNKTVNGGLTDAKGEFTIDVPEGKYTINVEFLSFKPLVLKDKVIKGDTNLGVISLEDEATKLDEVVIRTEKTTVEIKLDKKVYNVGQDLMVKGGTVSDVLDNIPSVAVATDGTISLRGNENVKILIDGRPSNAISINDALRMIPADAIDKVEVVTNPSARYDAEGGGGILNILLKKGKTNGINGTIIGTTGVPDNHGLTGTLNYKTNQFNMFTNHGYNNRNNPGTTKVNNTYNGTGNKLNEDRDTNRYNKGYNGNFGFDWFLDQSTTWTNTINYRRNTGTNEDDVNYTYFDAASSYLGADYRNNDEAAKSENIEYASNLVKKFKRDGHKLTVDFSVSKNKDDNFAAIDYFRYTTNTFGLDNSSNIQRQNRILAQTDYVLPFGKNSQFEAGYRGNFTDLNTNYAVYNNGVLNTTFTNNLDYIEHVNAFYVQLGTKVNKFSFLGGLRYEASDIDINQYTQNIFKNKKYDNYFPSATIAYELNDNSNISINYSKRINRPRGREINPFSSYSSNINIFQGNPDLNPSLTDAVDIGYLKKWDKLTFNTSAYFNKTSNTVQMIRKPNGDVVDGVPVIITTPTNIADEYRSGFEFTFNYTPYKWWKINTNFNFFRQQTKGQYTYTIGTQDYVINFDRSTNTWSSRITSKITLPGKIDWQTNANYNGEQKTAQGRVLGIFGMNLAFSKDILKEKGTLALNVNDVFNSRKRRMYNYTDTVDSYSVMQWRVRQVTLSFTYRFNKSKNDRDEKRPRRNGGDDSDGGDYQG